VWKGPFQVDLLSRKFEQSKRTFLPPFSWGSSACLAAGGKSAPYRICRVLGPLGGDRISGLNDDLQEKGQAVKGFEGGAAY
jgi:hypothetical protein